MRELHLLSISDSFIRSLMWMNRTQIFLFLHKHTKSHNDTYKMWKPTNSGIKIFILKLLFFAPTFLDMPSNPSNFTSGFAAAKHTKECKYPQCNKTKRNKSNRERVRWQKSGWNPNTCLFFFWKIKTKTIFYCFGNVYSKCKE